MFNYLYLYVFINVSTQTHVRVCVCVHSFLLTGRDGRVAFAAAGLRPQEPHVAGAEALATKRLALLRFRDTVCRV